MLRISNTLSYTRDRNGHFILGFKRRYPPAPSHSLPLKHGILTARNGSTDHVLWSNRIFIGLIGNFETTLASSDRFHLFAFHFFRFWLWNSEVRTTPNKTKPIKLSQMTAPIHLKTMLHQMIVLRVKSRYYCIYCPSHATYEITPQADKPF